MEHDALMSTSEMDRLTSLPEDVLCHIISFLPTKSAARTSILSRRFCHLWETSPVLNLDSQNSSEFVDLANRTIHHRNPPCPLISLRICLDTIFDYHGNPLIISYIGSLLDKAVSLGLRHLSVVLSSKILAAVLPFILSLDSLESLSIKNAYCHDFTPPGPINLKHLKSLCIVEGGFYEHNVINWLIPQLDALESLHIKTFGSRFLDLKSTTLKKLTVVSYLAHQNLRISTPSLELFELEFHYLKVSPRYDWEMPRLKKAVIKLENATEKTAEFVSKIISSIAHTHEFCLDITVSQGQLYPFHTLLSQTTDPPAFVELKRLSIKICCHEFNMQDLVTIVQHSPSIQVLHLVHKPVRARKNKKKKLWKSMLPRNNERNYKYAYFEDLHIMKKKEELLRKLMKKQKLKEARSISSTLLSL